MVETRKMKTEADDVFDKIVLAEERFQEDGFNEGKQVGQQKGYEDGYNMGRTHGSRIGAELGFYMGFVDTWKGLLIKDSKMKPRKEKAISSLLVLIEGFSINDPENPNLQEKLQEIRAKFKQVCSLLNINPNYKNPDQADGISF